MSTGKVLKPSPIIAGVPKSAKARIKTINAAARMVGIVRLMMTLKKRLTPVQPMLALASSRLLSMSWKAPFI